MITKTIKINRNEELLIYRALRSEGVCINAAEFDAVRQLSDRIDRAQPKGKGRQNCYKEPTIMTCDECGKTPKSKTLWPDRHRYLWCPDCWPYY
jgi:hypothetical protein